MIKTKETLTHRYFLDFFEGQPVKLMQDKKTGEVLFDADSVAVVLGYDNTAAMMANDQVMDIINDHKRETGESPLKQFENGNLI